MKRAQAALQTRTKAETIRAALQEVLRKRQLLQALEHQGKIRLDLDQKKLAQLRSRG